MNEHEISTPRDLDVALSANTLRKQSQLWKVAEGRSFRWTEVLGLVCAILLFAIGIAQAGEASGTIQIAFGIAMVGGFIWGHMQRQVNALVELVKRLEHERL